MADKLKNKVEREPYYEKVIWKEPVVYNKDYHYWEGLGLFPICERIKRYKDAKSQKQLNRQNRNIYKV